MFIYVCICVYTYIYIYIYMTYVLTRILWAGQTGDGQNGGWLRSHVETPTCQTFTRLCETPSCTSSTLSHLTRLRKLAHFTHIEPPPILHPPFFASLQYLSHRSLSLAAVARQSRRRWHRGWVAKKRDRGGSGLMIIIIVTT